MLENENDEKSIFDGCQSSTPTGYVKIKNIKFLRSKLLFIWQIISLSFVRCY